MTLRVGAIGAGFVRSALLPALTAVDKAAEVVAIASARLESAQRVADEFGAHYAYDDWQQMLERHQLDLVIVATPTDLHAQMAISALEAGAHVLCEKPMAMDATETLKMLELARVSGRVHMIDHELRFDPNYSKAHDLIASGSLGEIRHVTISNVGTSWADPAARSLGDWWSRTERGGGRLGANGSHQIDLLRWWVGEVESVRGQLFTAVPTRVDARTGEVWNATADDVASFMLTMVGGTVAQVFISAVARHSLGNHVEVVGSEGTIALAHDVPKLLVGRTGQDLREETQGNPDGSLPGIGEGVWNAGTVGLMRELVGAIRDKRPLVEGATFEDGHRTQVVMDAIRASSEMRRAFPVDVA